MASRAAPIVPASWREDEIVAGGQDLAVEGEIGLAAGVEIAGQVADHAEERRLDPGEVGGGGALRRHGRGGRLDDPPRLQERAHEIGIEGAPLALPGEQLGVEQVPAVARAHHHAEPRAGLDQALGGEEADRLAQGRPADLEALAQVGLVRQAPTRRPGPLEDAEAQAADYIAMNAGTQR